MKISVISRHPRLARLVVTRAVALSFALGGCVPATKYEQASSAAEVEREGHRRAVARLNAQEEELMRVKADNAELANRKAALEDQLKKEESELAKTSLDMEGVEKERQQQAELVTQLRGELARVGDHLKAFESDKEGLKGKLEAAESKIKLLESQLEYMKGQQETSEEAQERLRGALADLESMQQPRGTDDEGVDKPVEPAEDAAAEAEPTEAEPTEAEEEPADEPAVKEAPEKAAPEEVPSSENAPEEVLPEPDSES